MVKLHIVAALVWDGEEWAIYGNDGAKSALDAMDAGIDLGCWDASAKDQIFSVEFDVDLPPKEAIKLTIANPAIIGI